MRALSSAQENAYLTPVYGFSEPPGRWGSEAVDDDLWSQPAHPDHDLGDGFSDFTRFGFVADVIDDIALSPQGIEHLHAARIESNAVHQRLHHGHVVAALAGARPKAIDEQGCLSTHASMSSSSCVCGEAEGRGAHSGWSPDCSCSAATAARAFGAFGGGFVRPGAEDQQGFLAAPACDGIARSQGGLESAGDGDQHLVADLVAAAFVETA